MLLSLLLMYLSQPGGPAPWLTWVALVPSGLAIHDTPVRRGALLFYLNAIGWWLLSTWWLMPAIMHFSETPVFPATLIFLLLCSVMALPFALLGAVLCAGDWLHKPFGTFMIAAVYTTIVSWGAMMLPGNHAHSLYDLPLMIQVVDIGGVPFLLFIVVSVNWLIVKSIVSISRRGSTMDSGLPLAGALALIAATALYGAMRLQQLDELTAGENKDSTVATLKIGFIQPNLTRQDSLEALYSESRHLVQNNPDIELLIWPEFSAPFSYVESRRDKQQLQALLNNIHIPIALVSGYVFAGPTTDANPKPGYFNTAQLIAPDGTILANYNKQKLAPFYEYLPAERQFPFLRQLFPGTLRYLPGHQPQLFRLSDNIRVIPQICYEIVFPQLTATMINQGGNIIVNFTNDYWFGDSRGSAYHFALGIFRAVEHKVPLVRDTNTGISAVVDAGGRLDSKTLTTLLTRDARVADLSIPKIMTLYSRWGDWFLYLASAVAIVGSVLFFLFGTGKTYKFINESV